MTFLGAGVQHDEGAFTFCEKSWRHQDKKRQIHFPLKSKSHLTLKEKKKEKAVGEMAIPQNIRKGIILSFEDPHKNFLNTPWKL